MLTYQFQTYILGQYPAASPDHEVRQLFPAPVLYERDTSRKGPSNFPDVKIVERRISPP